MVFRKHRASVPAVVKRGPVAHAADAETPSGPTFFSNRCVLVSGAGGTVGSELCKQLLACRPARLILVDRSEIALFDIETELRQSAKELGVDLYPVLECVTRQDRMQQLIHRHNVSVVLHAAAYKHVPMVEANPIPGLENNLFGTLSLARAAKAERVDRFLLISTDKAIAPNGMLGTSKLLAERAVLDLAANSEATRFSLVRFGNVYGSSGSVVPVFQRQIARGEPVTLTDPAATRYFMSVQEAAELVLHAVTLSCGQDIFALDMGPPKSIHTLAREMIAESGRPDLPIRIIGLRPGERLDEQRPVTPDMTETAHPRIFRKIVRDHSGGDLALFVRSLKAAIEINDETAVRRLVDQWVFGSPDGQTAKSR